jgi:hypothetical protein
MIPVDASRATADGIRETTIEAGGLRSQEIPVADTSPQRERCASLMHTLLAAVLLSLLVTPMALWATLGASTTIPVSARSTLTVSDVSASFAIV